MTDDIKDEFYKQADDLARSGGYDAYRQGLARTLQDHAAFRQEVSDAAKLAIETGVDERAYDGLSAFILPPPDPDEELAREVAEVIKAVDDTGDYSGVDALYNGMALATIKALRDKGLLK